MRLLIDTDIDPNLIRITNYGRSEATLAQAASELQRVLMNAAANLYYSRRDFQLVGYGQQEPAIERWEWVASSNSVKRTIPRRAEIAQIEIRTQIPPEESPLPSKCLKCILEDDDETGPGLAADSSDPRLKLPK